MQSQVLERPVASAAPEKPRKIAPATASDTPAAKTKSPDANLIALGDDMQAKIAAYNEISRERCLPKNRDRRKDFDKPFDDAVDAACWVAKRIMKRKAQTFEGLIVRLRAAALLSYGEENPKAFDPGQSPMNDWCDKYLYEIGSNMVSIISAPPTPQNTGDEVIARLDQKLQRAQCAVRGLTNDQQDDDDLFGRYVDKVNKAARELALSTPNTIEGLLRKMRGILTVHCDEDNPNIFAAGVEPSVTDMNPYDAGPYSDGEKGVWRHKKITAGTFFLEIGRDLHRIASSSAPNLDPIFSLIEAYIRAGDAHNRSAEDTWDATEKAYLDASSALWSTAPTTLEGSRAKVELLARLTRDGNKDFTAAFLTHALENLLPAAPLVNGGQS